ncbi:hypothetical protein SCAR479_00591 [Seiridium cardinale]|uniref:Uncharacterized protein n=1 Tax=Seiridium cardinale TaxID=138064 RepID=A0ABR2Y9Y1_9PEZI
MVMRRNLSSPPSPAGGVYFHNSIGPDGTGSPRNDTILGPDAVGVIMYSATGWVDMNSMASIAGYGPRS